MPVAIVLKRAYKDNFAILDQEQGKVLAHFVFNKKMVFPGALIFYQNKDVQNDYLFLIKEFEILETLHNLSFEQISLIHLGLDFASQTLAPQVACEKSFQAILSFINVLKKTSSKDSLQSLARGGFLEMMCKFGFEEVVKNFNLICCVELFKKISKMFDEQTLDNSPLKCLKKEVDCDRIPAHQIIANFLQAV